MKVRVTMYQGPLRLFRESAKKAIAMTAEQLRTELIQSQYMPFDTGNIQNVQTFIDVQAIQQGQVKIVHDTHYAQRIYFHPGINFQTTTNANPRGLWWDDWLTGPKRNRAKELYAQFYRQLTGL